jgi:hypothetical protein
LVLAWLTGLAYWLAYWAGYWGGGSLTPEWVHGRVKPTTVPSPGAAAAVPYAEIRMAKPVA